MRLYTLSPCFHSNMEICHWTKKWVRSETHIALKVAEGDRRDTEKNIPEHAKRIKKYERLLISTNGKENE